MPSAKAEREGRREQREAVFGLVGSVWRSLQPGEAREGRRGLKGGLQLPLKALGVTEGFWKRRRRWELAP